MYTHSDPSLANDLDAVPDIEVFEMASHPTGDQTMLFMSPGYTEGWYWCPYEPGFIDKSEPFGPFDTQQDAINDAQGGA